MCPKLPFFLALSCQQKVTIDACQIYGGETVFLQQAAHLTGGSYLLPERRDALLQYLTVRHPSGPRAHCLSYLQMAFLPPPSIRKILSVPTLDRIDFRAACFCHKNIVDIGYVCSVCLSSKLFLSLYYWRLILSVFCKPNPVCSTCR
jgi:transcription initiation factor TFIIH subunit 3